MRAEEEPNSGAVAGEEDDGDAGDLEEAQLSTERYGELGAYRAIHPDGQRKWLWQALLRL